VARWDVVVVVFGAWFVFAYATVAILRLRYPFELEWMEGGMVDHVHRIMTGRPLYIEPSFRFVPFIYPPLYFYLGALVSTPFGAGFFPLRLLSFAASLGCFASIFALVRHETGHVRGAFLATAFFAACYPLSGWWYDLARVDSTYLWLLLMAAYLLRCHATLAGWTAAALALVLAFYTKQSAIVIAGPLLGYAVWMAPRRGLAVAALFAAVAVLGVLLLDRAHHGWYRYYVFVMPARIQGVHVVAAAFWSRDRLSPISIALALGLGALLPVRAGGSGRGAFYSILAGSFVLSAWLSSLHPAAHENVLIPAYAVLAVLFGLSVERAAAASGTAGERPGRLPGSIAVLLIVQFAVLVADPRRALPSTYDADMGRQLIARIRSVPGTVWLPQHGFLGVLAGKRAYAHSMAVYDVIRAGDTADRDRLLTEIREALTERRFDLVVADRVDSWFRDDLERNYQRTGPAFPSAAGFWPVTGLRLRPDAIYERRPSPDLAAGAGRPRS